MTPLEPISATDANQLPPVVLLHGIFRDHQHMGHLRQAFTRAGRRVLTPDLKTKVGAVGLEELAMNLGEYLAANLKQGERCDVIGHSMGGMVARAFVQHHGGQNRVRHLVTLASPHHGTLTAWLWPGKGPRDLRPGSAFLRSLAQDAHQLNRVQVSSYWTPFDLMIVPSNSSELPLARNVRLHLPHHQSLVTSPRLARDLVALLAN
ncbi:MAG TPA: alpha/beta fold hydrolase [Opitutales bacterium]|jgi:triacylglycerol lipase|nr:alpha/beta fold hydrolase [Opitutales bacterium]